MSDIVAHKKNQSEVLFDTIGLTKRIVHLTSKNTEQFLQFIQRFRRAMAFVVHPDTANVKDAQAGEINAAFDSLLQMDESEVKWAVSEYLHGTKEEQYGMRLELQQVRDELQMKNEEISQLQKQLEDIKVREPKNRYHTSNTLFKLVSPMLFGINDGGGSSTYIWDYINHIFVSSIESTDPTDGQSDVKVTIGYISEIGYLYLRSIVIAGADIFDKKGDIRKAGLQDSVQLVVSDITTNGLTREWRIAGKPICYLPYNLVDQRIKNTLFLSPGKLSHRRQHFSAKEPGSDYLVVANMYMTHEKMKEHSTMMFHEDVMVPNCNEITVVPIEKKGNFYPTRVSIGMTPPVAFRQSVEVKDETDISLISLLLPNSESYYSLISCPKYGVLYALDGGRKKKIDRTGRLISNKLKYRTVGDPKEDAFAFIVTSNGIESNEAVVRILLPSKPNH